MHTFRPVTPATFAGHHPRLQAGKFQGKGAPKAFGVIWGQQPVLTSQPTVYLIVGIMPSNDSDPELPVKARPENLVAVVLNLHGHVPAFLFWTTVVSAGRFASDIKKGEKQYCHAGKEGITSKKSLKTTLVLEKNGLTVEKSDKKQVTGNPVTELGSLIAGGRR